MPNFIEMVKPAWRKALQNLGLGHIFFVTDGQKRDYLSRNCSVREARLKMEPRRLPFLLFCIASVVC